MNKVSYTEKIVIPLIYSLLILLWVYTAGSKLADFEEFKHEMHNQVFSKDIANVLLYVLPAIEITAAILLLFPRMRFAGFTLSLILMMAFTIYIGLALAHVYPRMPCSCGGILKHMSWSTHFIFNLVCTAVAAAGILLTYKRGRAVTTMKRN